jgi:hypothetical protein
MIYRRVYTVLSQIKEIFLILSLMDLLETVMLWPKSELVTLLYDKQVPEADALSCATLAALPLNIALTYSIGKDILSSILFKT